MFLYLICPLGFFLLCVILSTPPFISRMSSFVRLVMCWSDDAESYGKLLA